MAHSFHDKQQTRPVKQLLGVLWAYIRQFKKLLLIVSTLIMLYTLSATLQPVVIQLAIQELLSDSGSTYTATLIMVFFGLSILVWIFQSMTIWVMSTLSAKMVQNIREDSFSSLVNADMRYHHKNQSGNITARVVSDSQEIANGLNLFTNTATELLLVISTLIILAYINVIFLFIALLGVPMSIFLSKFFGKLFRQRSLSARQAFGLVSGKLAENLSGIGISKAFKQENRMSEEFSTYNQRAYQSIKRLILVGVFMLPSLAFVSTLLVYAILLIGGYLYSLESLSLNIPLLGSIFFPTGSEMSIDIIFLGTILIQRFLTPINQITQNYTQLQAALGSVDRVTDVLEFENTMKDEPNAKDLIISDGSIIFEKVSFSYDEGVQVLNELTFEISGGEKIALVGHTGAGKSTISNLIMRFYDPIQGFIAIDGQKLTTITTNSIHQNVGLVTQDPYIFAGTILENIRYAVPNATKDQVYEVCKLIGAHEFITVLPDEYKTIVQESGKSLSAGQRQMITIARVFLSQPKLVILDEATSRLDAYTEAMVQHAQNKLFEGRTTIIIAHRLSTIQDVDRIIVLDSGSIKGIGTHEELYQSNNKYKELYRLYYGITDIPKIQKQ